MNTTANLCPVCNQENEENATTCEHCGAQLEAISTKFVGKPKPSVTAPISDMEVVIDVKQIPERGIGVQVAGETKALYAPISWELIIGRKREPASTHELLNINKSAKAESESLLDLSEMHAGTLGVSRRHAMIRQTVSGYEITDLSSRNGTWLNGQQLVPNKPYPLPNKSQLRLANMRLLVMYRPTKK